MTAVEQTEPLVSLDAEEREATAEWIASLQLDNGMIPWFRGGHADSWNHVEAAMALTSAGRLDAARLAYEWLADTQHPDGSWPLYTTHKGVEDPRLDPNVCCYLATGLLWYEIHTGSSELTDRHWGVLERAVGWALELQQPGGEVLWSRDPDGTPGQFALLTSTSSICHSLRCAIRLAERRGSVPQGWSDAAARMTDAVANHPERFSPRDRWAMDWYYPALCGCLSQEEACKRLDQGWFSYVWDGVGVRCVNDHHWITAAETAECAIACFVSGQEDEASQLLSWTRHLRDDDSGAYWTGCVHPQCVRYPGGERSTYTAAAVLIADQVINGRTPAASVFTAT